MTNSALPRFATSPAARSHQAAATVLLAAVSLVWLVAVDVTPASQRP